MGDIHDDLREVMGLLGKATPGPWAHTKRNDPEAPASIASGMDRGMAYAVAMCPRFRGDDWHKDADAIVSAVAFLRQHGPALLAAAKYEEANPLGGPATMLEAAARRIREGEDFHEVLADYGLLARQEGEDARDADRYRWLAEKIEAMDGDDTMEVLSRFGMTYSWWPGFTELVDAARSGGGG